MRLAHLIVYGFKSFADKVKFTFDTPITGIVGPNGCGKSNVVDAIKWVLGEQSAKSLRGGAMADVIFNGSKDRKPAGVAEVTLVFTNPPRDDGTRTLDLDADEVAVGRRLHRDGTSEYLINGTASRLKDVRGLFMDTGVGVDAYSVIEQGRVAAMLDANPDERRLIFEEAAGISRFKAKKKEAERKLERTEHNLLRLSDIVEEVEKRLRSVKMQATKARNYQELSSKLSELRLTYALKEYHDLQSALADLAKQTEDASFRRDDLQADLQRSQNQLAEARTNVGEVSGAKQKAQHEALALEGRIEQTRQKQAFCDQRLTQIATAVEQMWAERSAASGKLDAATTAEVETRQLLERLTAELADKQAGIEKASAEHRDGQLQLAAVTRELEELKQAAVELMRQHTSASNRLHAVDAEVTAVAAQRQKLAERRRTLGEEVEQLEVQLAELSTQMEHAETEHAARSTDLAAAQQKATGLGEQMARTSARLSDAKSHRSALASRQKVLADLEARREGLAEGVRAVLNDREHYPYVRGLVADVLRVDADHATVIEASLDGRDQWLIVDEDAPVPENLKGRVAFLPSGTGVPHVHKGHDHVHDAHATAIPHRIAADLVRTVEHQHIAQQLLGTTAVVETLDDARSLRQSMPGWRFVTRHGEVLEADGVLKVGPLGAAMSLISRRSELEHVTEQLAESDRLVAKLQGQIDEGTQQVRDAQKAIDDVRNAVYAANTAKVQLASKRQSVNDRLTGVRREQPLIETELRQFLNRIDKLQAEQADLQQRQQALETQQSQRQGDIEQHNARHAEVTEAIKQLADALTGARVAVGQTQEQQLGARTAVGRAETDVAEFNAVLQRFGEQAGHVETDRKKVEHELELAKRDEHIHGKTIAELRERLAELATREEQLGITVRDLARRVDETREQLAGVEKTLHEIEVKLSDRTVRRDTLMQRTSDELSLDLPTRYAEGYEEQSMDWPAVAAEIKELREKIARLGNVNLDAIAEQESLEQRGNSLAAQLEDLSVAKKQLTDLITTLNTESGVRFEETFAAVREQFRSMFRKLFGGGTADLVLQTEVEDRKAVAADGQTGPVMRRVNPLDAGIEIIARPPGKQPASITQLSGGEKTMTCIALLMSIFKSKPSPFCVLDEVDAALDEANNLRFNQIVQEFLSFSQFIVITHSKRTMQIADQLYGVTMQQPGVSTRVSVKFDQVSSDGSIAREAVAAA